MDSSNKQLSDVDKKILMLLQKNGRLTNVHLSRQINLSPPATHSRVKRLEDQGFIKRYAAILDHSKVGYDIECFINVRMTAYESENSEDFRTVVMGMPEVLSCHQVTGEYDYLLKVAVEDQRALEQFIVDRLTPAPGVGRLYTSLVLAEIKESTAYALIDLSPEA